jgi:hypothetical protein
LVEIMTKLEKRLAQQGAFLMLTHGEGYSLNDGTTVPRKAARELTADLFEGQCDMPEQRRGLPPMRGNEDGLFQGFSQTWSYDK